MFLKRPPGLNWYHRSWYLCVPVWFSKNVVWHWRCEKYALACYNKIWACHSDEKYCTTHVCNKTRIVADGFTWYFFYLTWIEAGCIFMSVGVSWRRKFAIQMLLFIITRKIPFIFYWTYQNCHKFPLITILFIWTRNIYIYIATVAKHKIE